MKPVVLKTIFSDTVVSAIYSLLDQVEKGTVKWLTTGKIEKVHSHIFPAIKFVGKEQLV